MVYNKVFPNLAAITVTVAILVFLVFREAKKKMNPEGQQDATGEVVASSAEISVNRRNDTLSADTQPFIVLLGVDDYLFKECFGKADEWSCKLDSLAEDCSPSELTEALSKPGLLSVVIQDLSTHWDIVKKFYKDGGFVAYFDSYGEFQAPNSLLSHELGFQWRFSAYTKHEYVLTQNAIHHLGNKITEQQYTKSNLVSAPEEDRWMVPKVMSLEEMIEETAGILDEGEEPDEEYKQEAAEARARYPKYCEDQYNQSPLVVHQAANGGMFAYMGFVNGDGNIPKIVRALLTKEKTTWCRKINSR